MRGARHYRFQYGLLENGFRQISMVDKPIRTAEDLRGMKMRVPDGQMFRDVFHGARGAAGDDHIRELYAALSPASRRPGKPAGDHRGEPAYEVSEVRVHDQPSCGRLQTCSPT